MALRVASSALLRRAFPNPSSPTATTTTAAAAAAASLLHARPLCTSPTPPFNLPFPPPHPPAAPATPPPTKCPPTTPARRTAIRTPHSRSHFEKRVLPFTPRQLYDVVANVEEYRAFVPWCTESAVTRRVDDQHLVADLSVGFRLLSERYTSVITLDPDRAVSVDVPHSSLFDYLINDWKFEPHGAHATELSFYVEFAFRNPIYQRVTDLFFEDVVKQMVGAFECQCHRKYSEQCNNQILHRW